MAAALDHTVPGHVHSPPRRLQALSRQPATKRWPPGAQCRQQRTRCWKHVNHQSDPLWSTPLASSMRARAWSALGRVIRCGAPLSSGVRARAWSAIGGCLRAQPCASVMALAYSGIAASSLSHSQLSSSSLSIYRTAASWAEVEDLPRSTICVLSASCADTLLACSGAEPLQLLW